MHEIATETAAMHASSRGLKKILPVIQQATTVKTLHQGLRVSDLLPCKPRVCVSYIVLLG